MGGTPYWHALLVLEQELLPHQALHHHHAEGDDAGADGHVLDVGALRRSVRVAVVDGQSVSLEQDGEGRDEGRGDPPGSASNRGAVVAMF